jgi:serine/threonine-protein kinase
VTAHQWFSKGEDHFIVLEFVDGCTLRALLDKIKTINSKIPVPIALEIGIQIADALQYIHTFTDKEKKGICLVHSDLNPNNILLDRSGLIKLIDFSTAQTTENIIGDTANKGRGIILYMSPEQAKSEGVDVRSDIFSLGILLFEMLLGTPPFPGESQLEVYYNLMGKEIAPKTFPIAMENDLKMILCKLLQKRKEDRYQTMEEVRLVLRDFKKNSFPSFTLKEIADFLKPLNEGF